MSNLQVFRNEQFGEVRVVEHDGEPWFVAKDVAKVLGYKKLDAMYRVIDAQDKKEIDPQSVENTGFPQNGVILESNPNIRRMMLITESGLYEAIFNSTLPAAKTFKRWVTTEVLPSIRKHGGYIAGQETMSDDELMAKALLMAHSKIEEKDKQIEQMAPKAIFADAVAASSTSILVGELAKLLKQNGIDTGQNRLFQRLRNEKYLISRKGSDYNMPTQRSMEMGLFEIKETAVTHSDGHTSVNKTVKVTGKGQQYFINKFVGVQ